MSLRSDPPGTWLQSTMQRLLPTMFPSRATTSRDPPDTIPPPTPNHTPPQDTGRRVSGRKTGLEPEPFSPNISPQDTAEIWQLKAAIAFWPPAFEHAEFCHRRRKGEIAGFTTQRVLLADDNGEWPEQEILADLSLHHYNASYVYWTLDVKGQRYVVHLVGRGTAPGPHWCKWMGVRERLEDRAVAFPWEVSVSVVEGDWCWTLRLLIQAQRVTGAGC